jgi:hypothetical protein
MRPPAENLRAAAEVEYAILSPLFCNQVALFFHFLSSSI